MTALHADASAPAATAPAAAPASTASGRLPPLVAELQSARSSFLEPAAFFPSWQGVLTLAYRGFTQPLIDLKARIAAAHPSLPPENPGSKWPKTSLGCLRDGRRLTPEQLALLCRICREESAQFRLQQEQHPGTLGQTAQAPADPAAPPAPAPAPAQQQQQQQQQQQLGDDEGRIMVTVDCAAVVLFECRSCERVLSSQLLTFQGGLDGAPPSTEEQARVCAILAEQDGEDYWFAVSRDGHRESHYRGSQLGATLMHPLLPERWGHEAGEEAHPGAAALAAAQRPGIHARGLRELADRRALLAAVARFRRRVDAELPGMYAFFEEASLHVTCRALIN